MAYIRLTSISLDRAWLLQIEQMGDICNLIRKIVRSPGRTLSQDTVLLCKLTP